MERIGAVLARLRLDPVSLRAARQDTATMGSGPVTGEEWDATEPPIALRDGGTARNGERKDGGSLATPVSGQAGTRPTLELVVSNRCLDTAKPHAVRPRAVVSRHLVLVAGGIAAPGHGW